MTSLGRHGDIPHNMDSLGVMHRLCTRRWSVPAHLLHIRGLGAALVLDKEVREREEDGNEEQILRRLMGECGPGQGSSWDTRTRGLS